MITKTFHNVLKLIQVSGLNFKMEISPFSATIHLKNSALKDINGNQLNVSLDDLENSKHASDIIHLENANSALQTQLVNALSDSEKMCKANTHLENVVNILHSKLKTSEQNLVELFNVTTAKHDAIEKKAVEIKEEAFDIALANETLNNVVNRLQKENTDSNLKAKKELNETRKILKAEIKSWRKELGEERRAKIKLKEKLDKSKEENLEASKETHVKDEPYPLNSNASYQEEVSCTICADYIPKYFHETEMNPACSSCQDSSISCDLINTPPYITTLSSRDMPTSLQGTKAIASLPVFTDDFAMKDVDEGKTEEMEIVRNEIRSKVKAKLEVRFKNGEISRDALNVLEKELVEELEEEAADDFKSDLKRRGKIT